MCPRLQAFQFYVPFQYDVPAGTHLFFVPQVGLDCPQIDKDHMKLTCNFVWASAPYPISAGRGVRALAMPHCWCCKGSRPGPSAGQLVIASASCSARAKCILAGISATPGKSSATDAALLIPLLQGTPFPAEIQDQQSWARGVMIAPDWERVGSDIINPTSAYNAAFSVWAYTYQ